MENLKLKEELKCESQQQGFELASQLQQTATKLAA